MAKSTTTTQNQHYLQAQSRLWEAYTIVLMASNANEEVSVTDMQTALRGALVLMDQGLEHLGEV
ncbi:hypothetical protein JP28_09315 [Gallibacterium anatis]|uniref:hypothetical protein n=1 Tax=Gallibacterium anatis TaxID=750 RepID=UPI000531BD0F|nr:hypothetical protein [Gallibacterium anatis]KGQ43245.1 hypothetical protein JP28_09315 [Gallibacterium anatis]KGQ48806.1 hypothetical protein IO46_11420 [Gallibacterium anatis]KGQ57256.1 hypothetical protein IO45_11325 [Gallibacterium anatis]